MFLSKYAASNMESVVLKLTSRADFVKKCVGHQNTTGGLDWKSLNSSAKFATGV